jgi:MFS family permease
VTERRRWFALVLAVAFLQQAAVMALRPMSSYRALELGAGSLGLGVVAGSFSAVAVLLAVPVGRWVDRYGEGRFAVAGMAGLAAGGLAALAAGNLAVLVTVQVMQGVGHLANTVALQTMLANAPTIPGAATHERRFGRFTVAASLGQLVGPAVAGFAAALADGDAVATGPAFVVGGGAALLGAVIGAPLWSYGRRRLASQRSADSSPHLALRTLLRVPTMPQGLVAGLTVVATVDLLVAYLPAYGQQHRIPVQTIGLLLAVRAGFSLLSRLITDRLAVRFERRALLLASLGVPALALLLLPLASSVAPLFAVMATVGFFIGVATPLTLAWVADLAPAGARGTVMAVRISGNRLAQTVLPPLAGAAAALTGLAGVFWGVAGLLAVAATAVLRAPWADRRGEGVPWDDGR